MALQSRGALLASFEGEFGVSQSLLGLIAPAGTLGFVLAILVAGFLAGRVDARRVMGLGVILTIASLVVLASAPVYVLLLVTLLGQGTAAGVFRGIDRAVLSHLYPERRGRVFALYAVAWALGAVLGPLAVSAVLRVADWRLTYLLLAAWFVPIAFVTWRSSDPDTVGSERSLSMRGV
jgi:MFS family permease